MNDRESAHRNDQLEPNLVSRWLNSARMVEKPIGRLGTFRVLAVELEPVLTRPVVTAREAITRGTLTVSEISDAGSVPELLAINEGNVPVLVIDGEELVGAKQNRIVNVSVLIAAASKCTLPVSCVEANRWSRNSHAFRAEGRAAYAALRSMKMKHVAKSYFEGGRAQSNQGAVWDEIDDVLLERRLDAPTRAMAEIFEDRRWDASGDDAVQIEREWPSNANGIVFMKDGELLAMELLGTPELMRAVLPSVLKSWRVAQHRYAGGGDKRSSDDTARNVLQRMTHRTRPGVQLGDHIHLQSDSHHGLALMWDGAMVHLLLFADRSPIQRRPNFGMTPSFD
jgi:hypothetical protein